MSREVKGVGGWLAFLMISLAILSPLRNFFGFYVNVIVMEKVKHLAGNPLWTTYKVIVLVLMVLGCTLLILAAYRLWRDRVWRSVRFAIMAMWLAGVGLDALALVVLFCVFGGGFAMVAWQNGIQGVLSGMVFPVIWTLYLLRSKRVRNTYRKESEIEEMARDLGVRTPR